MTPELWKEVRDLLGQALELPREERDAFVLGVCAGREEAEAAELRRELESLLAASADEDFLQQPVLSPAEEVPPARIGVYSIEHEIGRGGMGTVYLGIRHDGAYLQPVAIKVLNRGMDTDYFVRRFRYERQLLAYLNHPAIVHLLDGGSTEDGRPYLVTEFVEGETLRQYCQRTQASLETKLRLMIEVAEAVHHAHQRLIIHCDIKPSNILVTPEGKPKLLDFGVGRMFLPGLGSAAQTAKTQRLITPGYASPEQILGEPLTTATDVFSLGATLFELLVGRAPFGPTITSPESREAEPVSRAAAAAGVAAEGLGGDIDRIVAKAMRNPINERYESVEQLTADLRRYLNGEPVLARPLTLRYQLGKFVRRNRALTASVVLAVLAMVGGASVALWQRAEAVKERDTAKLLYENSRQLAHAFVFDMDDRLQKEGAIGARRLLVEKGLASLDQLAAQGVRDPELGRDLVAAYLKMGDVLGRLGSSNLGRTGEASTSYERALALSRDLVRRYPGNEFVRAQNAETLLRISGITKTQGKPQKALELGQEAVAALEPASAEGKALEQMRLLAAAYHDLGGTYSQMGRWQDVLDVRRKAILVNEKILRSPSATIDDRLRYVLARTRLASILSREKQYVEAEKEFQVTLREARAMYAQHPELSGTSDNLSNALMFAGVSAYMQKQHEEAQKYFREAHELRRLRLAADPKDWRMRSLVATSLLRWGLAEAGAGKRAEGITKVRQALQARLELAEADGANVGARAETGEAWAELALVLGNTAEGRQAAASAHKILDPLAAEGKLNQVLREVLERLGPSQ